MSRTGLVLSGGGARGAYAAGVLRYVAQELARRLPRPPSIQVVTGTSVGAVNGVWAAAHGLAAGPAGRLAAIWRHLSVSQVYRFDARDLFRTPLRLLRRSEARARPISLVDTAPLRRMMEERFPWAELERRLSSGELHAMVVSTTEVCSGRNVLFAASRTQIAPDLLPYPEVDMRQVTLGVEHVMASAAVPFLFPPVRVGRHHYVDGGLRQNTPLSPALRLGCDRIFVITVRRPFQQRQARHDDPGMSDPSLFFLAGKALNALLLDPVEMDMQRLERFNAVFDWGFEAFGPDFLDRLNRVVLPLRGAPYRRVRPLMIQPTEDLGEIAAHAFRYGKPELNRPTRILLSAIAEREDEAEADLLSYLLFDRCFTGELERLGWEDARTGEEEIARFFGEDGEAWEGSSP